MTTFYDQGYIRVTAQWMSIGDRRYPVEHLHNLYTARGPADPVVRTAALVAGLALAGVAVTGQYLPPLVTATILAVAAVPPAAVALVRAFLRPATYLLWADYRGRPVQLYQTRDRIEFGKLSRALVRACAYQRTVPGYVTLLADA
jgi:Family of unknown function (DUF6232)